MSHPVHAKSTMNNRALIIGLTLLCMLLLGFPLLFRINFVSAAVLHQIEQHFGHTIDMSSMRVTIFPRLGLELTDVRVQDSSTTMRIFSARRMAVVLQVIPLLWGQTIAERLTIEGPHLELQRNEAGQWRIGPTVPSATSRPAIGENPLAIFALVRNVLLTDGRVTLTDYSGPNPRKEMQVVTALQAIISEGLPSRTATLQVQGELFGESETATFSIEGTLIRTRLETPEDRSAASPYPLQFDGTIRLDRFDVRQLAAWAEWGSVLDGLHGLLSFSGRVRCVPRAIGYDVIVPDWTVGLRGVSLGGNATVTGLRAGPPGFSATFSSSPLPLPQWLGLIPERWISSEIRTLLSQHEVEGLLAVRTATIGGTLNSGSPVEVTAEMQFSEGRFLPSIRHTSVQDVSATMFYDRERIRVIDLQAQYGSIQLSRGNIVVTNVGRDAAVDARFTAAAQADGLIVLARSFNAPYIQSFLTGFEQAQGEIVVAAHLAGRPMTSESFEVIEADVAIYDVGIRTPMLPMPIHKLNGRLDFSSGTVRIDTLTGYVGPARVDVQGTVMIAGGTAYQDLHIEMMADGGELALLVPASASGGRPELAGPIHVTATVSGPLQTPRVLGTMELDKTDLGIPNIVTKPAGVPASMEFEGMISTDGILLVRRLDLLVSPIRIAGEGHLHLSDGWEFKAQVAAQPISLEKLPKGTSVGAVKGGRLEATLALEGRLTDRTSWATSGRIRLEKGLIAPSGLRHVIRNVAFTAQLDGQDIDIQHLTLTIGGSDLRARGSVSDWLGSPQVTLVIESSQFDLRLLQRTGRSEPPAQGPDILTTWLADGKISATVFVKAAYYDRFLFTNASCHFSLDHGVLTVDRLSSDTDDGNLGGQVVVELPERKAGQVRSAFRIIGIPIQRVLALVAKEDAIKGWMSISGTVEAELGKSGIVTGSVTSTRPIRLILEEGQILKVPVISKLLSVMNLPAILQGKVDLAKDGLPFDQLRGVFSVAHGIVTLKEIVLASPIIKISGSGRYDFMADQLDLVLATSPLGSYSDLLKRIPLFGKIFAGDREGFDTAVFEVKGASGNPDITYLPAESFTRGVKGTAQLALDVLVNALTLPKTIVEDFVAEEDVTTGASQKRKK